MSPPLLGVEGESQGNVFGAASSASIHAISHNGLELKERNYLGLSDCSSVDSSTVSDSSDYNKKNLNLKATELRLGLPGSECPERDLEVGLDEKPLFPLLPSKDGFSISSQKTVVSGSKRGFSDAMDGFSETKGSIYTEGNWMFCTPGSGPENQQFVGQGKNTCTAGKDSMLTSRPSGVQLAIVKDGPSKVLEEQPRPMNGAGCNETKASKSHASAPAAKAQVVGWPPIRSFRKNALAATPKNNEEVDGKPGPGALFIKVSMDGAPYLRKVDLRMYSTYQELSSALEKMFSCFTIGQCGSHGAPGREIPSDSKLRDLLRGSEYVLAYEDKDSDWMLVGDVPWEMFIDSCKRLKIMKSSNAIGLAPRAMEKSKNKD